MYRVTARVAADGSGSFDERSTRCGFRDFRLEDGYFRLNGRRIYLKSSHTGADTPVGVRVAYDRDLLRKDLLNCKVMGFNMIRFIAGVAQRYQLELCDEIGLLGLRRELRQLVPGRLAADGRAVRPFHAGNGQAGPQPPQPRDVGPAQRDRAGVRVLPRGGRAAQGPRLGRHAAWSCSTAAASTATPRAARRPARAPGAWRPAWCPTSPRTCWTKELFFDGTTWPPGVFALHPGINGEYSVVRWTAPADGQYALAATFSNIVVHGVATTDIHIFHQGRVDLRRLHQPARGRAQGRVRQVADGGQGRYARRGRRHRQRQALRRHHGAGHDHQVGRGQDRRRDRRLLDQGQPQRRLDVRLAGPGRQARPGHVRQVSGGRRGNARGHRADRESRLDQVGRHPLRPASRTSRCRTTRA